MTIACSFCSISTAASLSNSPAQKLDTRCVKPIPQMVVMDVKSKHRDQMLVAVNMLISAVMLDIFNMPVSGDLLCLDAALSGQ